MISGISLNRWNKQFVRYCTYGAQRLVYRFSTDVLLLTEQPVNCHLIGCSSLQPADHHMRAKPPFSTFCS